MATDDLTAVERYLHEHIPLSRDMGVTVEACDEAGVRLRAPLAPNLNHRHTAFGGSLSALPILAAWTLVHTRLSATLPCPCRVVIRSNRTEYVAPVRGDFAAFCPSPPPEAWDRFVRTLERRGLARIELSAEVRCDADGTLGATFAGEYVALKGAEDAPTDGGSA